MNIIRLNIETVARDVEVVPALVLSENETFRKMFIGKKVEIEGNPYIRGEIVVQRKSINDEWQSCNELKLINLKNGDWIPLELKSKELGLLIQYASELKESYGIEGEWPFRNRYIVFGLDEILTDNEINEFKRIINNNPELIRNFISLSGSGVDINNIANFLANSSVEVIQEIINSSSEELLEKINIASRIKLLDLSNLTDLVNDPNTSEQQFQDYFERSPSILSAIIPDLIYFINDRPYCGGQDVNGRNGVYGDFLFSQGKHNLAFIEIKKASTLLLSSAHYRNGIYKISDELANCVVQVKNQQYTFLQNRMDMEMEQKLIYGNCYVIIGDSRELDSTEKKKTFELFRNSFADIIIFTYDEIIEKVNMIKNVLMGMNE